MNVVLPRYSYVIAFASALFVAWRCPAQDLKRVLPECDFEPRTYAEWQERRIQEDALPELYVDAHPEYANLYELMRDRMQSLDSDYTGPLVTFDNRLAAHLIDELYVDAGEPLLNTRSQTHVIRVINDVAALSDDRLPSSARRILLDGLVEYVQAGGGQYSPLTQAGLAVTIRRLAKNPDPSLKQTVERLLWDAFLWAEEIRDETQRGLVYQACLEQWGDVFWLYAYETRLPHSALPDPCPESHKKAAASVSALLLRKDHADPTFLAALRETTQTAFAHADDRRLADDLACRLLLAYRLLLERRPPLHAEAARFIDRQLLETAKSPDRLALERHWKLWAKAATSLNKTRASDELKAFLKKERENADLSPERRDAFKSAAAALCE